MDRIARIRAAVDATALVAVAWLGADVLIQMLAYNPPPWEVLGGALVVLLGRNLVVHGRADNKLDRQMVRSALQASLAPALLLAVIWVGSLAAGEARAIRWVTTSRAQWWAVAVLGTLRAGLVSAAVTRLGPTFLNRKLNRTVLLTLALPAAAYGLYASEPPGRLLPFMLRELFVAEPLEALSALLVLTGLAAAMVVAMAPRPVTARPAPRWLVNASRDGLVLDLRASSLTYGARAMGVLGWCVTLGLLGLAAGSSGYRATGAALNVVAVAGLFTVALRWLVAGMWLTRVALTPQGARVTRQLGPFKRVQQVDARDLQLEVLVDMHGPMLRVGPEAVVAADVEVDRLKAVVADARKQVVAETAADEQAARDAFEGVGVQGGRTPGALSWLEPSRRLGAMVSLLVPGVMLAGIAGGILITGAEGQELGMLAGAVVAFGLAVAQVVWLRRSSVQARQAFELREDAPVVQPVVDEPARVARKGRAQGMSDKA